MSQTDYLEPREKVRSEWIGMMLSNNHDADQNVTIQG
jgi:hypothetical protein